MIEDLFQVDELQQLCGYGLKICDGLEIRQPILSDIVSLGELEYFSMIFMLTAIPSDMIAQLDKMGLKYRILARVKSIYSIWNKMQTKHVPFEEIYDLLAVRIIFEPRNIDEELNDCFDIYVSISKIYKPHPDRLRDWVSHPKANGYQALHVTLMGNNGQWIEVQIRSERMNDVAEQGFAAHWKYKEGGGSEDEGELEKWLRTIKEILDDPQPDAIDFLDTIKLNLFASEIFVFTPKGELKTMPQNSTALDFAFSLHTDIGSHCIGAKVNHKLVPLSHKLQSGDPDIQVTACTAPMGSVCHYCACKS